MAKPQPATAPRMSPGGMAIDADGNPAAMPRELASDISTELLNILTLLHAFRRENERDDEENDADGLTGPSSRATALMWMADDKLRAVVHSLDPYT